MSETQDYVLNYVLENRFYIEMESQLMAYFSECSGLSFKAKVTRFYEGGVNDQERILVEPPKFKPVKLKRGVTNSPLFWEWINQVWDPQSSVKRRNINILMFNQAGETMQSWALVGAIPIGWKSPKFKAKSKNVAVEELEIQYEGVKVIVGGGGGGMSQPQGRDALGYFGNSGLEPANDPRPETVNADSQAGTVPVRQEEAIPTREQVVSARQDPNTLSTSPNFLGRPSLPRLGR